MTLEESKIRLIMELRREGISDAAVLGAIERIPREIFIPAPIKTFAYDNRALPIGAGQTISQPYVVAYMTQALKLDDRCKVLEIGTGSGYQTAILAKLARRVYSIERHKSLSEEANARFKQLDLHTISTRIGDGSKGWPEQAPFDRIIVTAASEDVPEQLLEQLAIGGIMVVPIGPQEGTQHIFRFTRTEEGIEPERMLPVRFVPLIESEARDSA
ncbi:MAG: protein-L-isoaspartate(D-aspartate) O-methyltransferase [Nisaea sp.]|uniref:protein-L-isoaspartate(D-aspartate) O-methyltransferase n=1 Tax=Nisaea sp. TaxID=2024842 RepID=UPI001B154AF1|nr:protein-L-isoaspartate(D-aspartate) O-methyltransferase [Nisaea sp.]MBO6558953.1 protein-L-isoaspartate(D-aspartate) O-methyltransferase [Nisaea sp.]